MATKKPKGEWTSDTISEWAQSTTTTWKAQVAKSPDGTCLVGVRQYIKTKSYDGPGKGGISFQVDMNSDDALEKMQNMFQALRAHLATPSIPVKAAVGGKRTAKPKPSEGMFILKKDNGKYLTSMDASGKVMVSSDRDRAQLFTRDRAKLLLDHKLSDAWGMLEHVEE